MDVKGDLFSVEYCRGFRGCTGAALDGSALAGHVEDITSRLDGERSYPENCGRTSHHGRFRVSLSLCPNACSRPQIVDFGVIGAARPIVTGGDFTGCNSCVDTCREGAISIQNGTPVIDYSLCVLCGECARACPDGTIGIHSTGFRMLLGGKLGRHPRLGRELDGLYTAEEAADLLERTARLFLLHRNEKMRFADFIYGYDLADDGLTTSGRCGHVDAGGGPV